MKARASSSKESRRRGETEEIALKGVWGILLKSFGYGVAIKYPSLERGTSLTSSAPEASTRNSKNCSLSTLSTSKGVAPDGSAQNASSASYLSLKAIYESLYKTLDDMSDDDDVFSFSNSTYHPALEGFVLEDLHRSLWECSLNNSGDNYLLTFLRVTNNDVGSSVRMLAEALDWRINVAKVQDLLLEGDAGLYFRKPRSPLIGTFERREAFIRGRARTGSPLVFIRVKAHSRGECPDREYEKLILLYFEWTRLRFVESQKINRAQVVFDLSDFSLKNGDLHCIKFFIKTYQERYPDSCERFYVHCAPKVFLLLWNLISPWMKSHMRDKIVFTLSYEQLQKHIPSKYIARSLGGIADETPAYIPPEKSNCKRRPPDENFHRLMKERDALTVAFIDATISWIEAQDPEESRILSAKRSEIARARANNYISLDEYLRSRGAPDRNGEMGELLC